MRPQFLLDEHLSRAIQEQLREMHVRLIGDAGVPPLGTPDPDILMWVERNNYIPGYQQSDDHAKAPY